ncbi:MAG: 4Fe-4S binding protein [Elusimicrobia bacterium]|nr:4Fe-4S binding protein [Elusimicrobiota bacterium]
MSRLVYLKGVSSIAIDAGKCTGCGLCLEVCPHAVLELAGGKARVADLDACMECGACAKNCPSCAVSVAAGVGCAQAVIRGAVKGSEPACGCSGTHPDTDCC